MEKFQVRIPDLDDEWTTVEAADVGWAVELLVEKIADDGDWPRADEDTIEVEVLVDGDIVKFHGVAHLDWSYSARRRDLAKEKADRERREQRYIETMARTSKAREE